MNTLKILEDVITDLKCTLDRPRASAVAFEDISFDIESDGMSDFRQTSSDFPQYRGSEDHESDNKYGGVEFDDESMKQLFPLIHDTTTDTTTTTATTTPGVSGPGGERKLYRPTHNILPNEEDFKLQKINDDHDDVANM